MIITVKARLGSRDMERLSAACQGGHVEWHATLAWLESEAQHAAQREVLDGIERLANASPEQWVTLRIEIANANSGQRGHERQAISTAV